MTAISPAEYETRIHALEKLNATLAAEVDRMRPVVEAAIATIRADDSSTLSAQRMLREAVGEYYRLRSQREGTASNAQ